MFMEEGASKEFLQLLIIQFAPARLLHKYWTIQSPTLMGNDPFYITNTEGSNAQTEAEQVY